MKVLKKLSEELEKRSIAAKLIEDEAILAVYFSEEETGHEVYGDIFFRPFSDEKDAGGIYTLGWRVMEVSGLSDMKKSQMCTLAAVINSRLTTGGYGYYAKDDEKDEWLIFRMSIPFAEKVKDEWLVNELVDAVALSASVIKNTVDNFKDYDVNK